MATLSYQTRGNSSPQGKPRVYFSSHPDDRQQYFDSISQEILELQNCAIWYDSDPEAPCNWEERSTDLSQMQLFVMPVTTNLLTKPSLAMDQEFPFAMENHIPVLPLMEESSLEELFDRKFGDIQFLAPHVQDSTALPYQEKLKKFLESVLVGDELAEQVRAAFDAYIFLSYRKKDRREAQQLMRLIHENDFCRDIAIWYDEFLTPGENFNQAIEEALKKSNLFTLVVTPHLLENPNYVMSIEYPKAQEAQKEILPVEMETTDQEELSHLYRGLPECTDGKDPSALSSGLMQHLQQLALRENDDPQHNYFIGLAYLAGIDVEVNHSRAIELIRGGAEKGYDPAIEKLVSMYRTGEGVQRDYEIAIEWQKRLVNCREKVWEQSETEEHFESFLDALSTLGDYYKEFWDWKNCRWVWKEKVIPICRRALERYRIPTVQSWLSVGYDQLGYVCQEEGNLSDARDFFERSFELRKQLAEETGTVDSRRSLSISYDRLGNICQAEGNLSDAREYFEKSLAIDKQLAEETGAVDSRQELAVSYTKLGDICQAEGNLSDAREYFERSFAIAKQLAEETGTVDSRRDLSISYNRLGDICQAEGNLSDARKHFEKSLAIAKQLAEETGTVDSRRDLFISYNRLGGICQAEENLSDARMYFEKSLAIAKQLAEETGTVDSRRDLSISYNRLGGICQAEGNLSDARKYSEKSLAIAKQLAEETGTVDSRRDLSISYDRLGDICQAEGKLSDAREYFEKSLAIAKQLAEETSTVDSRRDLAVSYTSLGDICQAEGKLSAAREYFERSLAIAKQLAEEINIVDFRQNFALIYERLGDICQAEGKLSDAREYFEKSLAITKQLAEETNTVRSHRELSVSYTKLGDICRVEGNLSIAREYLKRSLAIFKQLVEETNTVQSRRDLSISYNHLGDICRAEGNLSTAREYFEKSLAIDKQLAEETKSVESFDNLAIAYYNLGQTVKNSLPYLQKALNIWTELAQQYPQVVRFSKRRDMVRAALEKLNKSS